MPASTGYCDSRVHSSPAIAELLDGYAAYKVEALQRENERLKAPVSNEEYETMFLYLNALNKEPGKPRRGMEVFNAIIASRATQTQETK